MDLRTCHLPADIDRFVGRRTELTEIKRLLSVSRLLTLTGVGGVGKTRLAVRVARDLQRTFRDGVWFIELAELRDAELLADTVAASLALRGQSTRWCGSSLAEHLQQQAVLLVLDNCEHLTDACAVLADNLLRRCTEMRILATSRGPLELAGESVLTVAALPVPDLDGPNVPAQLIQYDGVNLFLDRADAASPGFVITNENHAAVARLCHRLDGLPLAMELAAVQLRVLSVDEMLARLDDRFWLLGAGIRNAAERQQTLRSCMDWSFDLCTIAEQNLWRRLTVFHGGFDLNAAEEICADDNLPSREIFNIVAALVSKSLLQRDQSATPTRFRMLETVRQYGQMKLREAKEECIFQRRHRDWHLGLVEQFADDWINPGQAEWLTRLRCNHANLRAALEYCASCAEETPIGLRIVVGSEPYWEAFGLLPEARRWLGRLLVSENAPSSERCRALRLDAWYAMMQGDMTSAAVQLAAAEKLIPELDDPLAAAYVRQTAGMFDVCCGDEHGGIPLLTDALDRFRLGCDTAGEVSTLLLLGMAAEFFGNKREAADRLDECRSITECRGEAHWRAITLWMLGIHELWADRPRRAEELQAEALAISGEHDLNVVGRSVEAIGLVAAQQRRYERSAMLLGAADRIFDEIGVSTAALPALHSYRSDAERKLRIEMGEKKFRISYDRGFRVPRWQALDLALENPTVRPSAGSSEGRHCAVLTRRELQIAYLVADGRSNRDIAGELVISKRTAEGHVERILTKLGFSNRAQIAAWATTRHTQSG